MLSSSFSGEILCKVMGGYCPCKIIEAENMGNTAI